MIVKSLTWCTYNHNYLLPGQAIPLRKGVKVHQMQALYSDANLLLINNNKLVDVDKVVTDPCHAGAFLPSKDSMLKTLEFMGVNSPMIGNAMDPFCKRPVLTTKTVLASNWARTAGSLVELDERHSLVVAVETDNKKNDAYTEVWCPSKGKIVCLKIIDVPIVFMDMHDLNISSEQQYYMHSRTPFQKTEWWLWNAVEVSSERTVKDKGDRQMWLSHTETYVNVHYNLADDLKGFELSYKLDSNVRRIWNHAALPPSQEFAEV